MSVIEWAAFVKKFDIAFFIINKENKWEMWLLRVSGTVYIVHCAWLYMIECTGIEFSVLVKNSNFSVRVRMLVTIAFGAP